VECTFGILKGRWRILKTGIRLHTLEAADRFWKMCCALHNMLLDIDGLDEKWVDGVRSDWEGTLGHHEDQDAIRNVPFAIQRLNVTCPNARTFDSSGMGPGDDADPQAVHDGLLPLVVDNNNSTAPDGARVVRHLSLDYFRSKLVEHFDILWQQKNVVWPEGSTRQPTL
jgi:hypothetical protein